ncbi:MAG: IS630 family transposase, partial [endosymbiont of Lamellibrachia luymesi]
MAREGKMNSAVAIHLTPQEQTALQKNVRSRKTSIRLIERSKTILLAADGLSNIEIAEQLNISAHKVGRWRNRYAELGLPGIEKELPRGGNQGGKKTADQTRLRSKIIQTTTQTKPQGATHWSTRTLAKELGTTHSFVNRVWQESGLKPHLTKGFKVS